MISQLCIESKIARTVMDIEIFWKSTNSKQNTSILDNPPICAKQNTSILDNPPNYAKQNTSKYSGDQHNQGSRIPLNILETTNTIKEAEYL